MKTEEKNQAYEEFVNTAAKLKDFITTPAYAEWKKAMDAELWSVIRDVANCQEERLVEARGRLKQQFRIMDSIESFVRKAEVMVKATRGNGDDAQD